MQDSGTGRGDEAVAAGGRALDCGASCSSTSAVIRTFFVLTAA